jgi:hypothetical protein
MCGPGGHEIALHDAGELEQSVCDLVGSPEAGHVVQEAGLATHCCRLGGKRGETRRLLIVGNGTRAMAGVPFPGRRQ